MAVLKMQRISICALKKHRKAVLERLQSLGAVEVDIRLEDDSGLFRMDTSGSRSGFLKYAQTAERGLEVLQKYLPENQSMFSSLAGKPLIGQRQYEGVIEQRDRYIAVARKLIDLEKGIAEHIAGIQKLETQIEGLTPWLPLGIPMSYRGTRQTDILIGTLPQVMTLEELYTVFAQHAPEVEAVDFEIISTDKDFTYLAVMCIKADRIRVETALRTIGFAFPSQLPRKKPAVVREKLEEEKQVLEMEIQELKQKVTACQDERQNLKLTADYFRMRADKYEVLGQLPQTENVFFISGYIPQEKAQSVADDLIRNFEAMAELEEVSEKEEPPVLLKNNKFAQSAEGVLASFGLPGKGEIDPSMVMSIFYVFLFGLMLSDAAYGLIVMIACGAMLVKFPRMGESLKKSVQLFFWCGVSTLFWGIMFGGYFGDLITVVSGTFFGHEVTIPALWFVPLDDPMKLLVYSMLFGLIHLFTGLGMKGYMCLRDRKYMDFFCDVVLWFCLLVGLVLMLLPTEMFASISKMTFHFPAAVVTLSKVLALGGALGILLMSGRSSKNFGVRIALGAYDLYNITGWLSDILSYSRLLALGLATGVMASVFNQMGSMAGGGVLGAILFILVFVVGHTFNIGINLLGAYVHTCRLQYVEFFGKFYEGGGRAFNPFKKNTKYVDIKEEKIL
ncbi:V-type ATP synthase subunit I [Ruminococcus sp. OA3]|uniref:V-type ATP synthase subunit I n=1 Tax=Ruminococcus sp. OA3 TaxID=2914164 RepID=UPI001F055B2F|nr:V-type ATP synthase subunit I [Ruminococcus sp. OA3]MCH1984469.1 V-type ATP synthase subunit I [Ruminococcus sp. OA3]